MSKWNYKSLDLKKKIYGVINIMEKIIDTKLEDFPHFIPVNTLSLNDNMVWQIGCIITLKQNRLEKCQERLFLEDVQSLPTGGHMP